MGLNVPNSWFIYFWYFWMGILNSEDTLFTYSRYIFADSSFTRGINDTNGVVLIQSWRSSSSFALRDNFPIFSYLQKLVLVCKHSSYKNIWSSEYLLFVYHTTPLLNLKFTNAVRIYRFLFLLNRMSILKRSLSQSIMTILVFFAIVLIRTENNEACHSNNRQHLKS